MAECPSRALWIPEVPRCIGEAWQGPPNAWTFDPLAYAALGIGHSVALLRHSNEAETPICGATVDALLEVLERGVAHDSR